MSGVLDGAFQSIHSVGAFVVDKVSAGFSGRHQWPTFILGLGLVYLLVLVVAVYAGKRLPGASWLARIGGFDNYPDLSPRDMDRISPNAVLGHSSVRDDTGAADIYDVGRVTRMDDRPVGSPGF